MRLQVCIKKGHGHVQEGQQITKYPPEYRIAAKRQATTPQPNAKLLNLDEQAVLSRVNVEGSAAVR